MQPAGNGNNYGAQEALPPSVDLSDRGCRHWVEADKQRMPGLVGLHGGHESHLVLGATAYLAAQVGIVDLDAASQLPAVLTVSHDLHQLVLDQPGRLVGDTEMAPEREGGDVVVGLGHEEHGQKPGGQSGSLVASNTVPA